MSLKNNACGLTAQLTEEPCKQGTKPCLKRTPFFVAWCNDFGEYPRGSIVYTNCGFHFTANNTRDNPSDPNGDWTTFSMGVILDLVTNSMTGADFKVKPGVSKGCRKPVGKGEIRSWANGIACSLEDDNATAPKYTEDGDRADDSKWSKVISIDAIMCKILLDASVEPPEEPEPDYGTYFSLKNAKKLTQSDGDVWTVNKDTAIGPIDGSEDVFQFNVGPKPQEVKYTLRSSYWYLSKGDEATFPPLRLVPEYSTDGGVTWDEMLDGKIDRVGLASTEGEHTYENEFTDTVILYKQTETVDIWTRIKLLNNPITGDSELIGNSKSQEALFLQELPNVAPSS